MISFAMLFRDIAIYVGSATALLLGLVAYNPRLMLQDYPPEIKQIVPPKTDKEKRLTIWLGLPFLLVLAGYPILSTVLLISHVDTPTPFLDLWLYGFLIAFSFNLWDWLILDWLLFCTLTLKIFIIPGSEGHPGYKNYRFHFRGFLIGSLFSCAMGLFAAGVAFLFHAL